MIAEETIAHVVAIAKTFLIPHARTAFAMMGADRSESRAHRVLGVVRDWPSETITRRDIHQHTRRSIPDVNDLDRPLALLEEHGYLHRLPTETTGAGRKPSPTFAINPRWRNREMEPPLPGPRRQNAAETSNTNAGPPRAYTESTQLRHESPNGNSVDSVYEFRADKNHVSDGRLRNRRGIIRRIGTPSLGDIPWDALPGAGRAACPDPSYMTSDGSGEPPLNQLPMRDDAEREHAVADVLAQLTGFTLHEVEQFRREVADAPDDDPFAAVDRAALDRFDSEYGRAAEASA